MGFYKLVVGKQSKPRSILSSQFLFRLLSAVIIGFWPGEALLQNLRNSLAAEKYRICYMELSCETSTKDRT